MSPESLKLAKIWLAKAQSDLATAKLFDNALSLAHDLTTWIAGEFAMLALPSPTNQLPPPVP